MALVQVERKNLRPLNYTNQKCSRYGTNIRSTLSLFGHFGNEKKKKKKETRLSAFRLSYSQLKLRKVGIESVIKSARDVRRRSLLQCD